MRTQERRPGVGVDAFTCMVYMYMVYVLCGVGINGVDCFHVGKNQVVYDQCMFGVLTWGYRVCSISVLV